MDLKKCQDFTGKKVALCISSPHETGRADKNKHTAAVALERTEWLHYIFFTMSRQRSLGIGEVRKIIENVNIELNQVTSDEPEKYEQLRQELQTGRVQVQLPWATWEPNPIDFVNYKADVFLTASEVEESSQLFPALVRAKSVLGVQALVEWLDYAVRSTVGHTEPWHPDACLNFVNYMRIVKLPQEQPRVRPATTVSVVPPERLLMPHVQTQEEPVAGPSGEAGSADFIEMVPFNQQLEVLIDQALQHPIDLASENTEPLLQVYSFEEL